MIKDITNTSKIYPRKFSFCTLVTKNDQYELMVKTANEKGFTDDNSEFLYINNIDGNSFDAYSGIKHFFELAEGQYIVICHQDLLFEFDDCKILESRLDELNRLDSQWAMVGNAGGNHIKKRAYRITEGHGLVRNTKNFPFLARSIDENFMIANRKVAPTISRDLEGFHLYGTDLCKLAQIAGHNSYVIDFHLKHYGEGKAGKSFDDVKKAMIDKYGKALDSEYIQTTITHIALVPGKTRARFINSSFAMFFIKGFFKLKNKFTG